MRRKNKSRKLDDLCRIYIAKLRTFVELNFPYLQEDTDDTVQSILEKVVQRYDRFDPDYSISTWIYTIARNHCIDLIRKQKRTESYFLDDSMPENQVDPQSSPEMEVERQWEKQQLKDAFMQLPFEERQVLYLFLYEELKLREIARVMEKPLGSVKTMKYRAKRRIKDLLEAEYVG